MTDVLNRSEQKSRIPSATKAMRIVDRAYNGPKRQGRTKTYTSQKQEVDKYFASREQ